MDSEMKLQKLSVRARSPRTRTKMGLKNWSVKYRKCVCTPLVLGKVEFPTIWSEFRLKNQLCDGVISCDDGTVFKIHRAILSAVSPYFRALFTNSINRNQPETTEAGLHAPSGIINKLIDYAYTGCCKITHDDVELLLKYADQYEMLGVIQLCCQYVFDQLRPNNCIGVLHFARHYFCKDLERRGRLYVIENFPELVKQRDQLCLMYPEELTSALQDDELNIKNEEVAVDAMQKWIEFDLPTRKVHLMDLIKSVRLGRLSPIFLKDLLTWNLVQENKQCLSYVNNVLKFAESRDHDIIDTKNPLTRPRIPREVLFTVGGWSAGSPTNFVETYDCRADHWFLSVDTDSVPRAYHGLCTLHGLIYMIGGFDGNEHFNTVRCFDPVMRSWRECACMYYPRCYVSVVMCEGKIYAMGGYNGRIRMNSAERYDPVINQWQMISPMQKQRSDASAAALNGKIYIVGGFNGHEVMSSAEVYDILTDQWSFLPHMISARSGVSLVAFRDTLYAIGGFNGFTRLSSGEKYLLGGSNGWTSIADMLNPRSNFAAVVLDELIFAIGGFNDRFLAGSSTINSVECYNPDTQTWYEVSPMNLNRSAMSACVVSGLPNARGYSLVGRNGNELSQDAGNDANLN